MALTQCRECQKEVSTEAEVCPHCGIKNPALTPSSSKPPAHSPMTQFPEAVDLVANTPNLENSLTALRNSLENWFRQLSLAEKMGLMAAIALGLGIVVVHLARRSFPPIISQAGEPGPQAEQTYEGPINSLSDAQKAAVGVWTYTEPLDAERTNAMDSLGSITGASGRNNSFIDFYKWIKIEFREDGSCSYFAALPTASDWGKAHKCGWKIYSDKYGNTGERFYGIKTLGFLRGSLFEVDPVLIFENAQLIEIRDSVNPAKVFDILKKGDVFPFSK